MHIIEDVTLAPHILAVVIKVKKFTVILFNSHLVETVSLLDSDGAVVTQINRKKPA